MATYMQAATPRERGQIRSASSINLAVGAWLVVAPFILASTAAARLNDIVVGIAIVLLATVRVSKPAAATKPASWINVILGLWLVIAPFVLGYASPTATWNDIVVGLAVVIFGIWSGSQPRAVAAGGAGTTRTPAPRAAGLAGGETRRRNRPR